MVIEPLLVRNSEENPKATIASPRWDHVTARGQLLDPGAAFACLPLAARGRTIRCRNLMSQPEAVEFILEGAVAGQPISATGGIPFTRFLDFNEDVQKYVQGSDNRAVLHDLKVQVQEGSYLLRVLLPVGLLSSLISDTVKLAQTSSLADIDPVRGRVIQRWQERAKMDPDLRYVLRSPSSAFAPVVIAKDSNFLREERVQWVQVERYLVGEITDWGGAQSPNVHLRPRNTRDTLIIDATEDQIRTQRENLVYHKAIVHVRARQNPKTGELKDYRLVELRAYEPDVADAHLQELFDRGAKAWSGVPDGGGWVDELRGGSNG